MLIWELVQGDSPVSTRTFEKPLHTVMPVEVMLFADAGLQGLEVGVGALHRGTQTTCRVRGFEDGGAALRALHPLTQLGLDHLNSNDAFLF